MVEERVKCASVEEAHELLGEVIAAQLDLVEQVSIIAKRGEEMHLEAMEAFSQLSNRQIKTEELIATTSAKNESNLSSMLQTLDGILKLTERNNEREELRLRWEEEERVAKRERDLRLFDIEVKGKEMTLAIEGESAAKRVADRSAFWNKVVIGGSLVIFNVITAIVTYFVSR